MGSGAVAPPVGRRRGARRWGRQGESWGSKGQRAGRRLGGLWAGGGVGSWDLFGATPVLSGGLGGDRVAETALLEVGAAVVGGSRAVGRGASGTPAPPGCGGRPYSRATPSAGSSRGRPWGEGNGRCRGVRQRKPRAGSGHGRGQSRVPEGRAPPGGAHSGGAAHSTARGGEEGGGGRDAAALRCPLRCHLEAVRGGSAGVCRGGGRSRRPPRRPPPHRRDLPIKRRERCGGRGLRHDSGTARTPHPQSNPIPHPAPISRVRAHTRTLQLAAVPGRCGRREVTGGCGARSRGDAGRGATSFGCGVLGLRGAAAPGAVAVLCGMRAPCGAAGACGASVSGVARGRAASRSAVRVADRGCHGGVRAVGACGMSVPRGAAGPWRRPHRTEPWHAPGPAQPRPVPSAARAALAGPRFATAG